MADDRIDRKEALLAAARERLTQEQEAAAAGKASPANSGPEIRYRGQIVRQSTSGTPGAPSNRSGGGNGGGGGNDDVRAALLKIKALYRDGLISRAEAEKKRSDILDRL